MRGRAAIVALALVVVGAVAFAACGSSGGSECFYANMCVAKCGGPVVKSGCGVSCDPPLIEVMQCPKDSSVDDAPNLIQDTGADTPSDAVKDAPADSRE